MILAASILAGMFVAWLLFDTCFEDGADFLECVRYYFTPDILSMLRGEWAEDWWAEFKLGIYLAVSVGGGCLTYFGLHKWLG